ncbi:MAG: FixH family protein [Chitinophagales bacterium]
MFKKFNWGWGIALVYGAFVVFMLTLVYRSTQTKEELVTEDYYGKELKYQEQIDKQKRAESFKQPLQWKVENHQVQLTFPAEVTGKPVKADVTFYRPNDSKLDFNVSCTPDASGICAIASDKFAKGTYKMQVEWNADGVSYYNEGQINMN